MGLNPVSVREFDWSWVDGSTKWAVYCDFCTMEGEFHEGFPTWREAQDFAHRHSAAHLWRGCPTCGNPRIP